ncbi:DsrH/TusB family sulfur relay protein [Acinetobacter sp. ANC 3882]|uniref:DsrH/TusB family sulfur relay protein n=1 Tax=Acinetobacter sp. ANC 3882 TaxID=2923423 RepID=UPI001F4AF509|nr:DsrH/TusB family sulfur relay protein [Acinetobacter sp. ANC 3882]MCH7313258.1 DsrH/TusB family sulfur relay protein [Acinetobacter sp. ANC 3882]
MENTTLILVQSTADLIWSDLLKMAQSDDCIVLMGDAAAQVPSSITTIYHNIYCLTNEYSLLSDDVKDQIQEINYAQFADLVLKFKRCISLK